MKSAIPTTAAALFLLALVAASGCRSAFVMLPAEPPEWKAEPAGCVTVGENEQQAQLVLAGPGKISPRAFTWANSEIRFRVFDPPGTQFNLVFYDTNYARIRKTNASKWFELGDRRAVSLEKDPSLANYAVHTLWLGGDDRLAAGGVRAFGGTVTLKMDIIGLPRPGQPSVILSEAFKIGQWNEIRIRVQQGEITVWINGERGKSIQCDPSVNGPFAFEASRGTVRLADIKLTKL